MRAALVLAALGLTACTDTSSLTEVLPDDRLLVDFSGADASETARSSLGGWSEFYVETARTTTTVNGFIGSVLTLVDTIVRTRPSEVNRDRSRAVWGPYRDTLSAVEVRLTVQREADGSHRWWFDQWPKDQDDSAAVVVIQGTVDPGATRQASTGQFEVDYTAMGQDNPLVDHTGVFWTDYVIDFDGASAVATVTDWTSLRQPGPPIDASYDYDQVQGGEGRMDLSYSGFDPVSAQEASYALRSRWLSDGAGRGDATVSLANQGDNLGEPAYTASECWDSGFKLVWDETSWEGGQGDASACAYSEASWPE